MAKNGILVLGFFLLFFRFGSATYCSYNSNCDQWASETCCSDGICRRKCSFCSYDFECGTGEECCDGGCLSSCPTTSYATLATVAPRSYCTFDSDCELDDVCCDGDCLTVCSSSWSGASIVGTVFGTIVFFAVIFSFVSCYFCAWCPYHRYRSPGAVIISGQVPYQPFVTTTQTTMTQNVPPPPNYNQPPPPGFQPPPPYISSYPHQPAQHPPAATASGQPSVAPKVTA